MAGGIESSIDESLDHEERACRALEAIADALQCWCKLEAQRFEKEYPVKTSRDAIVTHIQTEEELLAASLGLDGSETLEEWSDLDAVGPREREVVKKKSGG